MSFHVTFQFEQAPTVHEVFRRTALRSEHPLRLYPGNEPDWYWFWNREQTDFQDVGASIHVAENKIEVCCSLWSQAWGPIRETLVELGGVTPVPVDPNEPNPVYDQFWYGIVMEFDDWAIEWTDHRQHPPTQRKFVIVDRFLELVYDDNDAWTAVGYPFQELEDAVWHGPVEVDDMFSRIVDVATEQAHKSKYKEAVVALEHLQRFVAEAREAGATMSVRNNAEILARGTVAELLTDGPLAESFRRVIYGE